MQVHSVPGVAMAFVVSQLAFSCAATSGTDVDPFRIVGERHFLDGYPARTDSGAVRVVVEIPAGTLGKWEVDKEDGSLAWEFIDEAPRVVQYLGYPGNYGMVPGTLLPRERGGDGDPLDVLVLGTALERGSIAEVRMVGVMQMLDQGEQDDKLIAVQDGTPFERARTLDDLTRLFPGSLEILEAWFSNYKREGGIEVVGFAPVEAAEELLQSAIDEYEASRRENVNEPL